MTPRYIIGIDLGTTNCSLSYMDTLDDNQDIRTLRVLQWDQDDTTIESDILPSFLYLPPKPEWKNDQKTLPLHTDGDKIDFVTGRLAKKLATTTPDRVIHSAKSWLSHSAINRYERILPWHSDEIFGDHRKSPVEVSAIFLTHLRQMWDHSIGAYEEQYRFKNQKIVITVPASFDEIAQRLTLEAARLADYPIVNTALLEEPMATFYHFLHLNKRTTNREREFFHNLFDENKSKTLLVLDIGGGTTDFSLFEITYNKAQDREIDIRRVAISDHILCGGDNIDLSIAYALESQIPAAGKLAATEWAALIAEARKLKERIFSSPNVDPQTYFISIAAQGSSLFASTTTVEANAKELKNLVLKGFFPQCHSDQKAQKTPASLKDWGLPYPYDSAISRHLAEFLNGRKIDAVLYTGGTLKPKFLQDRITDIIASWQPKPTILANPAMDLAVSKGAAYYGFIRHYIPSLRIRGGYPRSLYIEITNTKTEKPCVLCIIPKGFDSRKPVAIDKLKLELLINQPAKFQLYSALNREKDRVGDLIELDNKNTLEFHQVAAMETILTLNKAKVGKKSGSEKVDISLEAVVTETSLLELFCVCSSQPGPKKWLLSFNLSARNRSIGPYSSKGRHLTEHPMVSSPRFQHGVDMIRSLYGNKKQLTALNSGIKPRDLTRQLEQSFGQSRNEWDIPTCRCLWEHLKPGMTRRIRSIGHEYSWLYLAGYCLRPGYGDRLDPYKISELWRVFSLGLDHPKEGRVLNQWWIMWRRVAGGLNKDQQESLFSKIFPAIIQQRNLSPEIVMLAGSLERIDMNLKIQLGYKIIEQLKKSSSHIDQKIWTLTRLGGRSPLYGGKQAIISPKFIAAWFELLEALNWQDRRYQKLNTLFSQSARIINDRQFDLPLALREKVIKKLTESNAAPEHIEIVKNYHPIDFETQTQLFGETLPPGLILGS